MTETKQTGTGKPPYVPEFSEQIAGWQQETEAVRDLMPWVRSRLDTTLGPRVTVPEHDLFDDQVRNWALRAGVYTDTNVHELDYLQVGKVIRLCVPDLPDKARLLIAMYFAWITAVDDGMADQGTSLAEVGVTADRVLRFGAGPRDNSPTIRTMSSIREGLLRFAGADVLPTVADLVTTTLRFFQHRQNSRQTGKLPDLPGYLALRSGAFPTTEMIIMHIAMLCPGRRDGPAEALIRDVAELTSLIHALDNDLITVLSDLAFPQTNVVFVLANDHEVPLIEACRMAISIIEALRYRLTALVEQVQALSGIPELVQQADVALAWTASLHTWIMTAARYQSTATGYVPRIVQ